MKPYDRLALAFCRLSEDGWDPIFGDKPKNDYSYEESRDYYMKMLAKTMTSLDLLSYAQEYQSLRAIEMAILYSEFCLDRIQSESSAGGSDHTITTGQVPSPSLVLSALISLIVAFVTTFVFHFFEGA